MPKFIRYEVLGFHWFSFQFSPDQQVHDYIKPAIYSCIGDMAMSLGGAMDKYLQYFLQALQAGVAAAAVMRQRLKEARYATLFSNT
jgi:hypothetical protein